MADTVLVFGASGATGTCLLPRLLAGGAERVIAVSRQPAPAGGTATWLIGELPDRVALPAGPIDAIVSLGPLDAFAAWFARAAPGGVQRVVALSSMSVQSKAASNDAAERALVARLLEAERCVRETAQARGIAWTVLRPTLIYGAGGDRSLAPIVRFARRWRVLPVPLGATGLRQPVHADDLAGAVAAALSARSSGGAVYPLGGGERLTFARMLRRLGAAMPGVVLPLPMPVALLRLVARLARRGFGVAANDAAIDRLREDLVADIGAAQRDLGHAPRAFIAADVVAGSAPRATRF